MLFLSGQRKSSGFIIVGCFCYNWYYLKKSFQQSIKQYLNDKAWLEHRINQCLSKIDTGSYIVTQNSIKVLTS